MFLYFTVIPIAVATDINLDLDITSLQFCYILYYTVIIK